MKKTINSKIFKIASILLFSCFLGGLTENALAAGQDNILIYSNIYNASEKINVEFDYEISPLSTNPGGAVNEPKKVTIGFNNIDPTNNLTTSTGKIDFSGTTYAIPGIYKYTVKEISSSNPDYLVSSEEYEIYVTATNTGIEVNQQAKKLSDGTKGNLNFNHEPEYSHTRINLTVIGDEADKQEYFRFKVFVDSLCFGCTYEILGQDEYVNFEGSTIKTADQYTVFAGAGGTKATYAVKKGDDGTTVTQAVANNGAMMRRNATYVASGTNHIYLKHGQSVTIGLTSSGQDQIPVGTLVRVMSDQDLSPRKWTMYIDGVETKEFEHYVGRNIDFDIVLERNMLVPNTGLFVSGLPYLLLIVIGGIGIYGFVRLKAKNAR